jgi:hypothetical protein
MHFACESAFDSYIYLLAKSAIFSSHLQGITISIAVKLKRQYVGQPLLSKHREAKAHLRDAAKPLIACLLKMSHYSRGPVH